MPGKCKAPHSSTRGISRRILLLILPALAVAFGSAPMALAQQQTPRDLTVERIYSAPSLSGQLLRDVRWSPDGKLLSYMTGNGERAEIWVVDPATGQRRVLVDAAH